MLGAITVLVLALAVSACNKFGSDLRQIRFSAVSYPESEMGKTRTAYSGSPATVNNKYVERIDWQSGDEVLIASDVAQTPGGVSSAVYSISGITPDTANQKSEGDITPVNGNGLQWGDGDGDGPYRFMGVYPSTATINTSNGTVSGMSIPDTQDVDATRMEMTETNGNVTNVTYLPNMSNAWMLADRVGVSKGADVELQFYPAFTAFEFNILCQDASANDRVYIRSFTLSSASLDIWGSYSAALAVDGGSVFTLPTEGNNKSITVIFDNPVEVSGSKSVTFTLFTLPRNLNDLSISITASRETQQGTFTRKLALKNSNIQSNDGFITFDACKKHRILALSMPDGDFRLIFDFQVAEWELATNDPYEYESPLPAKIKSCDATYRRFDSDDDFVTERTPYPSTVSDGDSSWEGSSILVSYGYKNHEGNQGGEIVIVDDDEIASDETDRYAGYRAAFSPVIALADHTDGSAVLRLVLDNPLFKFIQYETSSGGNANHRLSDSIDITEDLTYFSVVPARQLANDVSLHERVCTVSLLSVAEGTLHEMEFNKSGDNNDGFYRLPGDSAKQLRFFYVGPSAYATAGDLRNANGTHHAE